MVNEMTVYTVHIKLPFLLRWVKPFIELKVRKIEQTETLKGESATSIIIDDCL